MQHYMLSKLVSCLLAFLLFNSLKAQEVLRQVQLQKTGANTYRIRYQLAASDSAKLESVQLRILRRRNGLVEEIHSRQLPNPVTRSVSTADWKADTALVKPGDQLQATIAVQYRKTDLAKRSEPSAKNLPPTADAGPDVQIQLPRKEVVSLNAIRSRDQDGNIVYMNWKQLQGPNLAIVSSQHFYKTNVSAEWQEGVYLFEFTVTDDKGASSADTVQVRVLQAPDVAKKPAPVTPPPTARIDTPVRQPATPPVTTAPQKQQTQRVIPKYEPPPMKGGPANALLSLAVPGLGHYFVSGDHYGNNRKPTAFLVTALYGGAIGGAVYYKLRSESQYSAYKRLAAFREYQRDPNGNIIGVRGANEAQSSQHLAASRTSHKNFVILTGVAAGVAAVDVVYTLIKGMNNRRNWRRENRVSFQPYLIPSSQGMMVGVTIQF